MPLDRHIITLEAKDGVSKTLDAIGAKAEATGKKAEAANQKAARSAKDWEAAATKVGVTIGGLVGVTSKLGQAHVSETNQLKALQRAYGDNAAEIDGLAQSMQSMGIASDDAVRISALGAQSLIKNYGLTTDEISKLIERAADLTAVTFDQYGRQLELTDVTQRLAAALRGEGESAEVLGLAMGDSALAARAAADGLTGWTTTMTEAEKAAFRFKVIMEDSATAQGAAAEKADTVAGKVNAMKLQVLDAGSAFGGMLGPVGESVAVLGDLALAMPLIGAAAGKAAAGIKTLAASSALLSLAIGPVGIVAAAVAAAGAVYYLTTRESEQEKGVKALAAATDTYTTSLTNNTTALIKAGSYDIVSQTKAYLELWTANGQIAIDRIKELRDVQNALLLDAKNPNISDTNIWDDLVESGVITEYTAQVLAANDANADGSIDATEYGNALTTLRSGFTGSASELAKLTQELDKLDEVIANPEFAGQEIAEQARDIITAYVEGKKGFATALADLKALGGADLDSFNLARRESLALAEAEAQGYDKLTQSIYGGSMALRGNYKLLQEGIATRKAEAQAIRDATKAAIEEGAANEKAGREEMWTEAKAAQDEYLAGLAAIAAKSAEVDASLAALATTLERDMAGAAGASYQRVVGFTGGMVSAIQTTKDWTDAMTGVMGTDFMDDGTWSTLSQMVQSGKLDQEDYTEALRSQESIYGDLGRATDAANEIQIKQIDTLAEGTKTTADYLENIADMGEAEQALALAWADTDIAGKANDVATMAAEFGNMDTAQRGAFESMVEAAANTNPALAGVLEDLELIKMSTDPSDPGWQITMDESEATTSLGDVVDAIDRLSDAILGIPAATVAVDSTDVVNAGGDVSDVQRRLNELNGTVASAYANIYQTTYYNNVGSPGGGAKALGGVVSYDDAAALGKTAYGANRRTLVGEHGPELVNLPGGSLVTPNHATRYMPEMNGGGGGITIQTMTVVANNPEQFLRQMRSYSSTMDRR